MKLSIRDYAFISIIAFLAGILLALVEPILGAMVAFYLIGILTGSEIQGTTPRR